MMGSMCDGQAMQTSDIFIQILKKSILQQNFNYLMTQQIYYINNFYKHKIPPPEKKIVTYVSILVEIRSHYRNQLELLILVYN